MSDETTNKSCGLFPCISEIEGDGDRIEWSVLMHLKVFRIFDVFRGEPSAAIESGFIKLAGKNARLPTDCGYGKDADAYQASRPSANYASPICYLPIGIFYIIVSLCLAGYGAGYERGKKNDATQYRIERLISFGPIALGVAVVGQGVYLIYL